jgi:hypothetical protein
MTWKFQVFRNFFVGGFQTKWELRIFILIWRGKFAPCIENGSSPPYFDYGFAEGFYIAGGAYPAER